jgi:hypothetical protein
MGMLAQQQRSDQQRQQHHAATQAEIERREQRGFERHGAH